MQRAKRPSIELRYAEERTAPSSLDESFGSVGDASEPEGERAASFEVGAAQQKRTRSVDRRKAEKGARLARVSSGGRVIRRASWRNGSRQCV